MGLGYRQVPGPSEALCVLQGWPRPLVLVEHSELIEENLRYRVSVERRWMCCLGEGRD